MKKARCSGGIIFNDGKYLLVKHGNGNHWDFPKGHMEKNESEETAALREIYEETGLKVEIIEGFKESISYIDNINMEDKTVIFFLCKANESKITHITDDVIDSIWLDYEEALKKITYDNAKELLRKAEVFLNNLSTCQNSSGFF